MPQNLKGMSQKEQKVVKRNRMVEGGKARWWHLLLLDALDVFIEMEETKQYSEGKLTKLQKEHEQLKGCTMSTNGTFANVSKKRSFNQHLSLMLSVWSAFCEGAKASGVETAVFRCDPDGAPASVVIQVEGIEDAGYTSLPALQYRLWVDHSDTLVEGSRRLDFLSVSMSSSSSTDDSEDSSMVRRLRSAGQREGKDCSDVPSERIKSQQTTKVSSSSSSSSSSKEIVKAGGGRTLTGGAPTLVTGAVGEPSTTSDDIARATSYVKALSGERWLNKLRALTSYEGVNLAVVIQQYIELTVRILREHHPAQTEPFVPPPPFCGGGSKPAKAKSQCGAKRGLNATKKRKNRRKADEWADDEDEEREEQEEEEEEQYDFDSEDCCEEVIQGTTSKGRPYTTKRFRIRSFQEKQEQGRALREVPVIPAPNSSLSQPSQQAHHGAALQRGVEEAKSFTMDALLPSKRTPSDASSDGMVPDEPYHQDEDQPLALLYPWDCEQEEGQQFAYSTVQREHGQCAGMALDVSNFHFMDLSPFDISPDSGHHLRSSASRPGLDSVLCPPPPPQLQCMPPALSPRSTSISSADLRSSIGGVQGQQNT
jgi:hypothetical protein